MLSALYAYKGSYAKTLAFTAGDRFLEIGHSKDPNWMHVVNEKGLIGYVPKNYVALEQVSPLEMIELINLCSKCIHNFASSEGRKYSNNETESLQRLDELRNEWIVKIPTASKKKKPPPQPPLNIQNGQDIIKDDDLRDSIKDEATSFMQRGNSLDPPDVSKNQDPNILVTNKIMINSESQNGSEGDPYKTLVEEVRAKTNISFSTSHQVVEIVLTSLINEFPTFRSTLMGLLESRGHQTTLPSWEDSLDGRTLIDFLEKLRQCKDDEQQRSWALHEDEATIEEFLFKILEIINDGDSEACRAVLRTDDCRPLLTLVLYYQMETRWPLRKLLLQIFGCICQLSKELISYLSASVLPMELSREILDHETSVEQLGYSVLVLGMILSMGDTLPYTHFSLMNDTFIGNLFVNLESFNKSQDTEYLCEKYLCLILAFNLQYHNLTAQGSSGPEGNAVIRVLSTCREANFFFEKLLVLFNREEDPVAMFDFGIPAVNSVLCMMRDIYNNKKAAAHLYTNDEKVVCDILLRQITDLQFDDKRHYDYLMLLEGVLVNGKWAEHQHLRNELDSRLVSICAQSENATYTQAARQVLTTMRKLCR